MRVLAFDTSTENLSIALRVDEGLLQRDWTVGQRHAELLLPSVRDLLSEAGLVLSALDCIAFGQGPGSFTGLRIACGVAQGLAFGADLPVVPVSTLLALAQGSGAQRAICCLDARMGEVYHAAYRRSDRAWEEVCAPGLYLPEHVPHVSDTGWAGVGTGFRACHEALCGRYAGQLSMVDGARVPQAGDIATLAVPMVESGQVLPPEQAAPFYIRDKVALKTSER